MYTLHILQGSPKSCHLISQSNENNRRKSNTVIRSTCTRLSLFTFIDAVFTLGVSVKTVGARAKTAGARVKTVGARVRHLKYETLLYMVEKTFGPPCI